MTIDLTTIPKVIDEAKTVFKVDQEKLELSLAEFNLKIEEFNKSIPEFNNGNISAKITIDRTTNEIILVLRDSRIPLPLPITFTKKQLNGFVEYIKQFVL